MSVFQSISDSFGIVPKKQELVSVNGIIPSLGFCTKISLAEYIQLTDLKICDKDSIFHYLAIPLDRDEFESLFSASPDQKFPFLFLYVNKGFKKLKVSVWNGLMLINDDQEFEGEEGVSVLCARVNGVDVAFSDQKSILKEKNEDLELCLVYNFAESEMAEQN